MDNYLHYERMLSCIHFKNEQSSELKNFTWVLMLLGVLLYLDFAAITWFGFPGSFPLQELFWRGQKILTLALWTK